MLKVAPFRVNQDKTLLIELKEVLIKKYGVPIGEGRHRAVFLSRSGKYVIKLPTTLSGSYANMEEGTFTNYIGWKLPVAKCRLTWINDVPVLLMEHLDTQSAVRLAAMQREENSWHEFIDCSQVGLNRKMELVAYDWEVIDTFDE